MRSQRIGSVRKLFATFVPLIALSLLLIPNPAYARGGDGGGGGGGGGGGQTGAYQQTNLVSNGANPAPTIDAHLINPWGLVSSTAGPWWISDNFSGFSTLYNGQGQIVSLVVTIPSATSSAGTPTGIVFNTSTSFVVSQNGASGAAVFLFATADGTLSGWNPGVNKTNAVLSGQHSGAVYRGLALANTSTGSFLYATDFVGRKVDIYDGTFHLLRSFTDPQIATCSGSGGSGHSDNPVPSDRGGGGGGGCFAPFGIQAIGNQVFVTYVLQDLGRQDHFGVAGKGSGFVDVFDTNGNLLRRLTSSSQLNAPWGIAQAPANFGQFSNDLLIGNFGDGHINAFDPATGAFLGQLATSNGPIQIEGLWALQFGNGGAAGATNQLFFTAGAEHGTQGLFGSIQSTN